MKKLLWLDDMRCPFNGTWVDDYSPINTNNIVVEWVKSYFEFVNWIKKNGLPDAICFDHDLGKLTENELLAKGYSKKEARKAKSEEKNGYDCAKWLVEYCMDHEVDVPAFNVHSSNPAGKQNIMSYLDGYHKSFYNS